MTEYIEALPKEQCDPPALDVCKTQAKSRERGLPLGIGSIVVRMAVELSVEQTIGRKRQPALPAIRIDIFDDQHSPGDARGFTDQSLWILRMVQHGEQQRAVEVSIGVWDGASVEQFWFSFIG